MKILFVIPYFHDNKSSLCVKEILKYLRDHGDKIDILAFNGNGEKTPPEKKAYKDGFTVYTADNYFSSFCKKHSFFCKNKRFEELGKLQRKLIWHYTNIVFCNKIRTDNRSLDLVNVKNIKKYLDGEYDVILSNSTPFAAHVVAMKLKKIGVAKKWCPVLWDPYVNDNDKSQTQKTIEKRKKNAIKVLSSADKVFMLEGVRKENIRHNYNPDYNQNAIDFSLPTLLKAPDNNEEIRKFSMVFTGKFYSDIRNPEEMLSILSEFPKEFSLSLYGVGCRDIVEKQAKLFKNSTMVDFGLVTHKECLAAQNSADILINLENTVANRMPSKVFEYISSGKPVINFYYVKDDIGLSYLKKYPLCYNLCLNDYTEKDVENLIKFCYENSCKKLSFEEATENLKEYRRENVCKLFYDNIR